jgi:nitroreductase/dihydropteridine reductase
LKNLAGATPLKNSTQIKRSLPHTLEQLLATVRLAPSSLGLQHYKVVVVENPEVREKLKAAAYGQSQITDASQLIVFAAETNLDEAYVNKYVDEIVRVRQISSREP